MNKDYIVKKSNYFIMNTSYDLSLEEQKIILTLASMVQPEDEEFKHYDFRISDFMALVGVEDKSKYTEIPKITKELMKKVFEIQEGKTLIQTAWLSGARYEKGSGMVTLKFNPDLKPYMLQLNTMFTQYKLANILSMKSKYSPRVYELLKCNEYKKQGYIDIDIVDLRQLLKAENIYPRYYDFRRFILEATQKELKKLTDITFDFEEIRYGRKVTSIRFYIKPNKVNPTALDEVSATKVEADPEEVGNNIDVENGIQMVMNIMSKYKISPSEAIKIWSAANGDIGKIKEKYSIAGETSGIKNIVGFMILAIKKDYKVPKAQIDDFNNFDQREYDFDSLEKKLLGWDTEESISPAGEEYEQIKVK